MSEESVLSINSVHSAVHSAVSGVPHRQRGLSLVSLLFIGVIAILLLTIGFKLVPSLVEYLAIDRADRKPSEN